MKILVKKDFFVVFITLSSSLSSSFLFVLFFYMSEDWSYCPSWVESFFFSSQEHTAELLQAFLQVNFSKPFLILVVYFMTISSLSMFSLKTSSS